MFKTNVLLNRNVFAVSHKIIELSHVLKNRKGENRSSGRRPWKERSGTCESFCDSNIIHIHLLFWRSKRLSSTIDIINCVWTHICSKHFACVWEFFYDIVWHFSCMENSTEYTGLHSDSYKNTHAHRPPLHMNSICLFKRLTYSCKMLSSHIS